MFDYLKVFTIKFKLNFQNALENKRELILCCLYSGALVNNLCFQISSDPNIFDLRDVCRWKRANYLGDWFTSSKYFGGAEKYRVFLYWPKPDIVNIT